MEETSSNLTVTTADLPNLTSTIGQTQNVAGNPPTNSTTSGPEQNSLDTICQEDAPIDLKAISVGYESLDGYSLHMHPS